MPQVISLSATHAILLLTLKAFNVESFDEDVEFSNFSMFNVATTDSE